MPADSDAAVTVRSPKSRGEFFDWLTGGRLRDEPPPPAWADWDVALEEEYLAERYGWTVDEIDRLGPAGRDRVRYWLAVRTTWTAAEKHLAQWNATQDANNRAFEAQDTGEVRR